MKTTFRSTLLLSTILAVTSTMSAQDDGAGYSRMFRSSGDAGPVELLGLAPPVIGGDMVLGLDAPGAQFASLLISAGATTGLDLPIGVRPIRLYLDPFAILAQAPMPAGPGGALALPIPPDPAMVGIDLAIQAVVAAVNRAVGASNLLLANIGADPNGPIAFGITFQTTLGAREILEAIHENGSPRRQCVTVQVAMDRDIVLDVHVSGTRRTTLRHPGGSVTLTVNPGQTVSLRNASRDTGASISYTIGRAALSVISAARRPGGFSRKSLRRVATDGALQAARARRGERDMTDHTIDQFTPETQTRAETETGARRRATIRTLPLALFLASTWAAAASAQCPEVVTATDASGKILMLRAQGSQMLYRYQVANNAEEFGPWRPFGIPLPTPPVSYAVGTHVSGEIEVVASAGGNVHRAYQPTPGSAFTAWNYLQGRGQPTGLTSLRVGRNQDGRVEVFGLAGGTLYQVAQRAVGGPSQRFGFWYPVTSSGLSDLRNSRDALGQQTVTSTVGGRVLALTQVGRNGAYTAPWVSLGHPQGAWFTEHEIVPAPNGNLEVFAVAANGIWEKYQRSAGGNWSGWIYLGHPSNGTLRSLATGFDRAGNVQLFVSDGRDVHSLQRTPTGWAAWTPVVNTSFPGVTQIATSQHADGRSMCIAGREGGLKFASQVQPNVARWSGWKSATFAASSYATELATVSLRNDYCSPNPSSLRVRVGNRRPGFPTVFAPWQPFSPRITWSLTAFGAGSTGGTRTIEFEIQRRVGSGYVPAYSDVTVRATTTRFPSRAD